MLWLDTSIRLAVEIDPNWEQGLETRPWWGRVSGPFNYFSATTSTSLTRIKKNKIENLLGPLKMCRYDVVLNCYSIGVP